jgi:hypothetical protein
MLWPFSKIWGAGLVEGDVPTHADLNKLDEQQAQAADGAVWTDIAAVANMVYPFGSGVTNNVAGAAWRDVSKEWYFSGASGGNPTVRSGWPPFAASSFVTQSVPVGGGCNFPPTIMECNPAGVLLMQSYPTSGTNQKLRRSANGLLWTVQDTIQALALTSLKWFPAAGLWLAGYGSGTAIDTSPDGITWTARTVPNSHGRGAMAASPTRLVVQPDANTPRDAILTTDDGVTFVSRTVPNVPWRGLAYNAALQRWFMGATGGGIYSSPDAVTWTLVGTLPNSSRALFAFGRALISVGEDGADGVSVCISLDGAVTWRRVARWLFTGNFPATGTAMGEGGQLCAISSVAGEGRMGLRTGL